MGSFNFYCSTYIRQAFNSGFSVVKLLSQSTSCSTSYGNNSLIAFSTSLQNNFGSKLTLSKIVFV